MSVRDDERLERDLRAMLEGRDPGPAPASLRDRVDRIPDLKLGRDRPRILSALGSLAGLAAAAAVLLVVVGHPRGIVAPAGGATPTLPPAFDPAIVGPGLVGAGVTTENVVGLMLIAGGALIGSAMRIGGRRGFAMIVAVVLVGYGVAQTLTVDIGPGSFSNTGELGTMTVSPPGGSSARDVVYITAAAGKPFVVGVSLSNDGSLPVRLLGLRALDRQDGAGDGSVTAVAGPGVTAAWRDAAPEGTLLSPASAVPLDPIDLEPGAEIVVWLVGRAGPCAFGPAYSPSLGNSVGYAGLPELRVEYSVFGMPRATSLEWPYDVVEPFQQGACPPASSAPAP